MESVVAILGGVRGETAALVAALCWAVASVGWGKAGRRVAPLELNFIKGSIAVVLLAATLALQGELLIGVEWRAVWLLASSGAVGIGLGDTAYFEAINSLGARRALLLTMIAPPLAAVAAWVALGERLVASSWIGMALTIAGVAWVITERVPGSGRPAAHLIRGVWMGVLASLAQVVGAVLTRAAFAQTSVTPLYSALLRMAAAVAVVFVWIALSRPRKEWTIRRSRDLWGLVLAATFIGTYMGISLQQFAFKFADTGVAQTLLSTSPLFILPITVMMGEKVSVRAVAGVVVALVGIAMLFGIVG